MYTIKIDNNIVLGSIDWKGFSMNELAQTIGVERETLSRIMNGKQACSKPLAYCITKTLDPEKEINELFERLND